MAQKQFKIGLSNTDKQNMAQDVYERVLALTFNEYDTTTEYEVGDFVVYNDQLYKCISATSGAWDNSKWQLATLNDLVADIEGAVAFVNDKANVDGNYPTMTVGVADNLSPYDDQSGDDQDEPFSFQATGTGNGTQPDFSTGSIALMKEKRGNTVVVNQLAKAVSDVNYGFSNATGSFNDGVATFIANAQYGECYQNIQNVIEGHKYYIGGYIKKTTASASISINLYGLSVSAQTTETTDWQFVCNIGTQEQGGTKKLRVIDERTQDFDAIQMKGIICIDLTQWFGSNDNIPAHLLAHPEDFFRYYQGSLAYNEGTLVNANGRYIKCIGRNQWDEEYEQGSIISSTGAITHETSEIVSKNFIKVIPGMSYFAECPNTTWITIGQYDKDKNFISTQDKQNEAFTVPNSCCYIKIGTNANYLTTYNHDITISLYYTGEGGYDKYYPYEELANIDTGTETLRSAGSVKDYKTPDGTIIRNVGTYTFTGSESWISRNSGTNCDRYYLPYTSLGITNAKEFAKVICSCAFVGEAYASNEPYLISTDEVNVYITVPIGTNPNIIFASGQSLFYELAEPTTEQGTPFSENVEIDDFGSMDFGSDVPQGCLIFYPVDYKAFIDTLYKYTDGTPSNIALKSDLSADKTELQGVDTQLLNAVGGTLRQCLCVKETLDFEDTDFVDLGSLNWVMDSSGKFYATLSSSNNKGLCSIYKNGTYEQWSDGTADKIILLVSNSSIVYVRDTTYTDTTSFKTAMKGILLAYEKGE